MKKIILAFDSFKGSAGSLDLATSAQKAIKKELPDCEILTFPIADGGEGTAEALYTGLEAKKVTCASHDPLMRPITVEYAISKDGKTAILEMASASGLTLIENRLRNPMDTTTFGCGEIILDALKRGCRNFIMGIGGSATNDAGIGMMNALGIRFLDKYNKDLKPIGRNLIEINKIDFSNLNKDLKNSTFVIACDVNNPFYGNNGAAYIYAPQKGANTEEVLALDKGLQHYAQIIEKETSIIINDIPGAGAAGGMGGGLLPFINAKLKSGIEVVLEVLRFDEAIKDADLIFTGEGKIDAQTSMGKALNGILRIAQKQKIPVIALAGSVESTTKLNDMGFTAVFSIQPSPTALEKSMQLDFVSDNIQRTVIQITRIIKHFKR